MLPLQANTLPELYFCKTTTVSAGELSWTADSVGLYPLTSH